MKKLFIFLFLFLLFYASDGNNFQKPKLIESGAVVIVLATIILAILYAVGYGFNIQPLTLSAKDELYHLIISIVLLGSLTAITIGIDEVVGKNGLWFMANSTLNNNLITFNKIWNDITSFENVATEGTKMLTCQFFSSSLTMTTCGGFSALTAPANTANSIVSTVIVTYHVLQNLLSLGIIAMNIIFPLGIFFYSFKLTRPLGVVLVALSFSLYVILPFIIVSMENVYDKYAGNVVLSQKIKADISRCEPDDRITTNEKKAVETYNNMKGFLDYHMEEVLIKGLLFPIVYVLSLAAGVRGIAALAAVEVDVSAISRLM